MAKTSRLTDEEQQSLRALAAAEGISMQDTARRAIRDDVTRTEHRSRVASAADLVMDVHADALDRLAGVGTGA